MVATPPVAWSHVNDPARDRSAVAVEAAFRVCPGAQETFAARPNGDWLAGHPAVQAARRLAWRDSGMKKLVTALFTCCLLCMTTHALALKKGENFDYAYCDLDDKSLADPDQVIDDLIAMARNNISANCVRQIIVEQDDPRLGRFPAKAAKQLKMFGWGIYRERQILKKERGEPVDGYETMIYTVELNYVYAELESGVVPVCELSIVPIRLIKTPWGWYPETQYSFGSSMNGHARRFEAIQPRGSETIKKYKSEMARMHRESALHCPRRTSTTSKEM